MHLGQSEGTVLETLLTSHSLTSDALMSECDLLAANARRSTFSECVSQCGQLVVQAQRDGRRVALSVPPPPQRYFLLEGSLIKEHDIVSSAMPGVLIFTVVLWI